MAIKFQSKGRPLAIREIKYNNEILYCIDFNEVSKAAPPKDIPKGDPITSTALINQKQLNRIIKTIEKSGDTLETANQFFVIGEIVKDLPKENFPNEVNFIGFELTYIPRKEGVEFDGNKLKTSFTKQENSSLAGSSAVKLRQNELTKELIILHQKFNGVCQKCGQKCDKRLVRIPQNSDSTIVCIDCYFNFEKPNISVNKYLLEEFIAETSHSKKTGRKYLESFPRQYALVDFNEKSNTRSYWCWDETQSVRDILTRIDGHILAIQFRNGKRLDRRQAIKKYANKGEEESAIKI
ncbi:hypothetical protein C1N87_31680 (plasmid) [Priestia aryabhattai]